MKKPLSTFPKIFRNIMPKSTHTQRHQNPHIHKNPKIHTYPKTPKSTHTQRPQNPHIHKDYLTVSDNIQSSDQLQIECSPSNNPNKHIYSSVIYIGLRCIFLYNEMVKS
jgi:hypothetical protein